MLLRIRRCYSCVLIVFFAHEFSLLNQIGYKSFEVNLFNFDKKLNQEFTDTALANYFL